MERITLCRLDSVEPEDEPSSLCVTIRMKARPLRLTLLLGGIGLSAFALSSLLPNWAPSATDLILIASLAALGLLLAARLVWTLAGRERLMIGPLALSVRRSIGPIGVQRTYGSLDPELLQDPPDFCPYGRTVPPPWELLCLSVEQEALVLRHRRRQIRLARSLDKAERIYLLTAIRIWMQDR